MRVHLLDEDGRPEHLSTRFLKQSSATFSANFPCPLNVVKNRNRLVEDLASTTLANYIGLGHDQYKEEIPLI